MSDIQDYPMGYIKCRDKWIAKGELDEEGVEASGVKSRSAFAKFIGLGLPDNEDAYDPNNYLATFQLEMAKQAINDCAEENREPWRIRVNVHGESVVKLAGSYLVDNDCPEHWKRLFRIARRGVAVFTLLRDIPGLDRHDKRLLRSSKESFLGWILSMQGAVNSFHGITAEMKQRLISIVTPPESDEEDEEV